MPTDLEVLLKLGMNKESNNKIKSLDLFLVVMEVINSKTVKISKPCKPMSSRKDILSQYARKESPQLMKK